MVVGAKYDSSIMNDAYTNYPADIVGLPAKVIWPNRVYFWILSQILYDFCVSHQPANLGVSSWSASEL